MHSSFSEEMLNSSDNLSFGEEMFRMDDSVEGIFHRYSLTKDNEFEDIVHCFFEGIDDYRYYGFRIKSYTDRDTINYDCKGKDNVLILHGMIKNQTSRFDNKNTLFFVDKDFDLVGISYDDIYVTPCYAIENFYVMDETFNEFVKGEIGINKFSCLKDKDDFESVFNFYRKERKEFIDKITILNAWYSLQKNNGKEDTDLSAIKSVYTKKMRGEISLDKLKSLTPNYIEVSEEELEYEKARLLKNPVYNFRGKYYEEFLLKTLNKIITDAKENKYIFSKKRNINLTLGKDNIISLLSQYAYTPRCLKEYLNKRLITESALQKAN